MKLLLVARGYPTERHPVYGIFEWDQARAIAGLGHEVIYAYVDRRSFRRWRKLGLKKFKQDGILVYGLDIPLGGLPRRLRDYLAERALKYLYRKIEREEGRPDLVHSHFLAMSYFSSRIEEISDIPLVMTEHFSKVMESSREDIEWKRAMEIYPRADALISVSPALQKAIREKFNIESIYIANIVDTSIFKYEKRWDNESEDFSFITVGNLKYSKRMDLIIEAINKGFKDMDRVRLVIVGGGVEKKNLEDLVGTYGLEDRVEVVGELGREEIYELMKKSHCFVLPSRGETFGVAYIEAMATGLPVIATRCGGPEAFVNEDNGLMIEIDDLDGLVGAMKDMVENRDRYDGKKISEDVYAQFSPKSVARKIVGEYERTMDNE